jgi:hypothetical protein
MYAQQPIHIAAAFCPTAVSLQETHVEQRAYDQSRRAELENEADGHVVRAPGLGNLNVLAFAAMLGGRKQVRSK